MLSVCDPTWGPPPASPSNPTKLAACCGCQALPLDTRAELLHLPAGADFALCALHAGASRDTRLRQPVRLEAYEVAQALDCDAAAAGAWLAAATPFAHYVLSRRNRAETWVAAGGVGLAAR